MPRASSARAAAEPQSLPVGSRFVLPILAFAGVFQAVLQTVMVPLLPSMPAFTGAGTTSVSWLITATLLVGAVVTPIFGRLADMYGKKRMLMVAFVIMTLGAVLCAVTSDIGLLIFARGLQGVGGAVIPIGISILRDELPPEKVHRAIAMMSSTLGIGTALGLPFAAAIAEYSHWHVLFWVIAAIGLAVTTSAALFIRESAVRSGGRFDGVGAVGLTAALVSLLVSITQGSSWGWSSPAVLGMFASSVFLFALWGYQQLRNRNPLIDLRVSARRSVLLPHGTALLVGFAFYGNALITTQLLQAPRSGAGYGLTILQAAVCQLPTSLSMIVFAQVGASVTARFGSKVTILAGAVCLVAGYSLHAVPGKELWLVITALGVAAIGTALVYSTLPMLIVRAAPATQMAAANGVNVLLRTMGTTMCSAVVASVLAAGVVGGSATSGSFSLAYGVCAVLAVLVFAVSLALPGHDRSQRKCDATSCDVDHSGVS
ncbi:MULTISPECIES: MFS transporter [Rhodococcus]|uniref:MFS transporter n=1 Tax=Rhodococcus oxybenzonivorans TaxID=1990687 RepID=A0AAE4UZF0_9NOCA|nr:MULTISPECIES: MFS transporter [Rhodococcus]MDV7242869.1 MFS transporter [Rhodococcus oxybenzonivorans]MDV7265532.1 MFS transporter [Rhodococcus oxybenzonivorans]MDV7275273.1 MFS transporter [Rhodococcus oxybenzonivorans]MDV7334872.1 MFS transporter [Rhodococcus oxybenzonivorans]MDV7345026.1 MFS transporter [Rhodococcus oxybenzonivorans]